jgi:hypothetical protein
VAPIDNLPIQLAIPSLLDDPEGKDTAYQMFISKPLEAHCD